MSSETANVPPPQPQPLLPELPTDILEQLNSQMGPLNEAMRISFVEVDREKLVARMPVEGNTQPYGILHGGASGVIAETVGSVGSVLHSTQYGTLPVGLELSCSHHRSASSGFITATGRPLTLGKTMTCWEVVLTDDDGNRTCTARLTCYLRTFD